MSVVWTLTGLLIEDRLEDMKEMEGGSKVLNGCSSRQQIGRLTHTSPYVIQRHR